MGACKALCVSMLIALCAPEFYHKKKENMEYYYKDSTKQTYMYKLQGELVHMHVTKLKNEKKKTRGPLVLYRSPVC